MPKIFFAEPMGNGKIIKGTILHTTQQPHTLPILSREHEHTEIDNTYYLLVDTEPLEFLGAVPKKNEGLSKIFKSTHGTIINVTPTEVIETQVNWIRKGIQCNKGTIIEVGEAIAIVRDPSGKPTPFKKSTLQPIETIDSEAILKAHAFSLEIKKAIATGQNFPNLNQQATEGTTKQFGRNDTRRLGRGKDGKLRWMDADEYEKEVTSRQGKTPVQEQRKFKVGENISYKGEEVKVLDHSDKLVAYKKADGTTGTFEANTYNEEGEDKKTEGKPKSMTLGNFDPKKKPIDAAKEVGEARPKPIGEEAPPNAWYKEHQRIIDEAVTEPEYEAFVKSAEAEDYRKEGNFEYSKTVKHEDSTYELQKFYNTETKKTDFAIDGVQTKVTYDGQEYDLADVTGDDLDNITIRNADGIEQKISRYDIDKYQGKIRIDDDGKAIIVQEGKDIGEFVPSTTITQEDLLKEGTLRIIKDEIWKRTKVGDGVSFNDTLLGRVDKGIAFYKHGNEVGIVGDGYTTNTTTRNNLRRPVQGAIKDTEIQKRIRKETARLREEGKQRQDIEKVKARIEIENAPPAEKKGRPIDPSDYKDIVNDFIPNKETMIQMADGYGSDEWKANIKSLAEQMKVTDVQRATEIEAFNAMSKNGILKDVPAERPASDYLEASKDLLDDKYREFKRELLNEKITSRKQGDTKTKFERGELAEIPVNAKAVSSKTMKIRDSEENTYQVTYAIVPMTDVIQSHESSGEEHAEHPKELQARNRKTEGSKKQMSEIATAIDERVTEDSADANRGAPVGYSKDGKVYIAQGNGRTAGIKGSTGEARDTYFGLMTRKAAELGMNLKDIQPTDMLVRVLTPKHTYQDAITLGADQDTPAMPYTEVERTRAFQNKNPEGLLQSGQNINMKSIGNKPINETNVASWISDNPEIYKKILAQTGKQRAHIETSPKLQSEAINIAMMAQLKPDFIDDVSARDTRTHDLVKTVTPSLIENQRMIAEGKIPESADIQNIFHDVIKTYDSIDSNTKALMNIRAGQTDFLNDDDQTADANSLLHKMKQDHLFSTTGKEEGIFRDPLKVIGIIAYQQAMKPRDNEIARQQAYTQYALKVKRFGEALKSLDTNQNDIFGSQLSPDEQKQENNKKIIQIAERVFLENKPYQSGTEELSSDEQEASKEQYGKFDVYGKMKKIADRYGFALAGEEQPETILKSMLHYIFNYRYNREIKEIQSFIIKGKQLGLFPSAPKLPKIPKPTTSGVNWNKSQGQEKPGHKYLRREKGKSGKWEYIYEEPTGRQYATDEKGAELPKHRDWEQGTEVIHNGEKVTVHEMSDNIVALKKKNGDIFTTDVKNVDTFHASQKNLRNAVKPTKGLNVSKPTPKWDELISKLTADLEQGNKYGKYEFADDKAELERKIKYAEDERNKVGQKETSKEETLYHGTDLDTPFTGDRNTEGYWFSNSKEAAGVFGKNVAQHKIKPGKQIDLDDKNVLIPIVESLDKPKDATLTKAEFLENPEQGMTDWGWQNAILKEVKKRGYDSATFTDETSIQGPDAFQHNATVIFDKSRIEKTNSPNPAPITDTPEFKNWFKDSKIVDNDGKPLKVFHGTDEKNISEFKRTKGTFGIHFGTAEQANSIAEKKGVVYPAYLNIKNPFRMNDLADYWSEPNQWMDVLTKNDNPKLYPGDTKIPWDSKEKEKIGKEYDSIWEKTKNPSEALIQMLKNRGYDGVVYANEFEGVAPEDHKGSFTPTGDTSGDSYIVFDPEQIKSATANKGTFDPKEKDITKSFFGNIIRKAQLAMLGARSTLAKKVTPRKSFNPDPKFNDAQEGQTKNFNQNDKRVLKRGAFGKMRWFNADATDKMQQGLFDKKQTVEKIKHQEHAKELKDVKPKGITFYRGGASPSIPSGKTAYDVIKYEQDELGNEDVKLESGIDINELKKIPAKHLEWLTEKKKDAKRYGEVEAIELTEGHYRIIARDEEGGVLVQVNMDTKPKFQLPEPKDIYTKGIFPQSVKSFWKRLIPTRRKKLSSTQINIPKEETTPFIEMAEAIPDREIYDNAEKEFGRESKPHITVLFGLKKQNPTQVKKLVKDFGEITIQFGKTSIFASKEYDVLKVEVKSKDMHRLNKLLTDNVEYKNDHPQYKPHLTIAYLKKGEGKKYIDDTRFEGLNIKSSQLIFSDADRKHTPIEMNSDTKKVLTPNETD